MKILFLGNGLLNADSYPFPNVGGSVQTWGVSQELAKRGHKVFILRRNVSTRKEIFDDVNLVSIKFKGIENVIRAGFMSLPFHMARILSSLYFSKKSLKAIQRINPDIICLIDRFSGFFPSRLDIPKLYIMHVPEALDFFKPYAIHNNKLNSILFYIKKTMESKILKTSGKVVTLNSFIEKYLKEKGFNNIVKIPNGINVDKFTNNGDEKFILYAGRFDWNKNVCSLVNAFAEVHKLHPDYKLYLIGAGPEEGRIRSLVRKKCIQSSINIIPWLPRNKLINIMSRCSVFVLPSFFEVFSVVILEAMASGKPVIARTNMGTVDAITHGKTGYLYNNDKELRRYLELVLSDNNLRENIGRNARKIVKEEYTFEKIADKYISLLNGLLDI